MVSLSLPLKLVLISTSVLFLSLCLKFSVPSVVHDFSVNKAPVLWSSVVSWLKPPFLYVIINCIIITIAASSRFNHSHDTDGSTHDQVEKIPMDDYVQEMKISTVEIRSDHFAGGVESRAEIVYQDGEGEEAAAADDPAVVIEDKNIVNAAVELEESVKEVVDDISKSTWVPTMKRSDSVENNLLFLENLSPAEKPLVSSRFGHRKSVKASPEGGKALRVSKPKRHETLEGTWKMITEGRAMPLTRHVKKSETFKDTWENHDNQFSTIPVAPLGVKKSATFKDRTNYQPPPVSSSSPASGKLRREPSLSQDELNRRVEAFINKFNEEMRMQRQESLNQYKEMISRGGNY